MSDARPNPEKNFLGALTWIMDRLETIDDAASAIARLERMLGERRVSAAEMARDLGYASDYLYKPWRMPDYGRDGTMHTRSAWLAWLEKPEASRRLGWDKMPMAERKKILGADTSESSGAKASPKRRSKV